MPFIQWCCERGARTKKPWLERQLRSLRFSFHKYFSTFFYLFPFFFFNYFTLSFFPNFFLPTTHDPRHLATLMKRHYPELAMGSASYWLDQISHAERPIRSTTQIWGVTRNQYEISELVPQTSFGGESKCRLFLRLILWLQGHFTRVVTGFQHWTETQILEAKIQSISFWLE